MDDGKSPHSSVKAVSPGVQPAVEPLDRRVKQAGKQLCDALRRAVEEVPLKTAARENSPKL